MLTEIITQLAQRHAWGQIRLHARRIEDSDDPLLLYWLFRAIKATYRDTDDLQRCVQGFGRAADLAGRTTTLGTKCWLNTVEPELWRGSPMGALRRCQEFFDLLPQLEPEAARLIPHAHYKRGETLAFMRRWEAAELSFRAVMSSRVACEELRQMAETFLAETLLEQGLVDAAEQMLSLSRWEGRMLPSVIPYYLAQQARLAYRVGHHEQAVQCATMAHAGLDSVNDPWARDHNEMADMAALVVRCAMANNDVHELTVWTATLELHTLAIRRSSLLDLVTQARQRLHGRGETCSA